MEPLFNADGHTKAGTAGGTLLAVLLQVSGGEVVKTIVLAAIGAAVSFMVSLALKWGLRRLAFLNHEVRKTGRSTKRGKVEKEKKRINGKGSRRGRG